METNKYAPSLLKRGFTMEVGLNLRQQGSEAAGLLSVHAMLTHDHKIVMF
jgi:hypothetical protein